MAWLSVIIPTYNGEKYLARALESIQLQDELGDIEYIVVDDGSSDDTIAIARGFSDVIPIVFLEKLPDKNWVSSTNFALQKASGDFVCFLHQDDLWLPGRLKKLKILAKQYPEIDCFFTSAQFIDSKGRGLGVWQPPFQELPVVMPSSCVVEKLLVQNSIAIPAPMFKKSCLQIAGAMDESLWYTADWDLWLKLAVNCKVGYCADETVAFRIHNQSQTFLRSEKVNDFGGQMRIVLDRYVNVFDFDPVAIRAAGFSIDVNVALAAALHGQWAGLFRLALPAIKLDWRMLYRYFSSSCIMQRILARIFSSVRNND